MSTTLDEDTLSIVYDYALQLRVSAINRELLEAKERLLGWLRRDMEQALGGWFSRDPQRRSDPRYTPIGMFERTCLDGSWYARYTILKKLYPMLMLATTNDS